MFISQKKKFLLKNINNVKKKSLKFIIFLCKKYSIFNFNESIDISIIFNKDFIKLNKIIKDNINLPFTNYKFNTIFILVDGYYEYLVRNLGYLGIGLFIDKNFIFNEFKIFITINKFAFYINEFKKNFNDKNLKFIIINNNDLEKFLLNFEDPINFKINKNFNLNLSIGKINFNLKFLEMNFIKFINKLKDIKNNLYINKLIINKIFISTTMGLSFLLKRDKFLLF